MVKDKTPQEAAVTDLVSHEVDSTTTSYLCDLDTHALNNGDYTLYLKVRKGRSGELYGMDGFGHNPMVGCH